MTNRIEIIIEDGHSRKWRATYERTGKGQFAKLFKLERFQNNGKDAYWCRYAESTHGPLTSDVKIELERAARMARVA